MKYPDHSLVASEIAEQPALWPTTLQRIGNAITGRSFAGLPVVITGAGTSAYAARAIADAWPGARAIPTTDLLLQSAEEIRRAMPSFVDGGLLISLARSGDSPESVGVVGRIKRMFPAVEHIAIVCNADGRLAHANGVQVIVLDPQTNDRSLAMTASFSNLVLGGLCLVHGAQIAERLPALCQGVSASLESWNETAAEIAAVCADRLVVLASSMRGLAAESALKVVELTAGKVVTLPESFLGVRHGPLTFAREDTPIICFVSSDARKRLYELEFLRDVKERGFQHVVVVGDDAYDLPCRWFVRAGGAGMPDYLRTPFDIPFSQLLAYQLSLHTGVDPDNPSPNGAVTRVVKPFHIHDDSAEV